MKEIETKGAAIRSLMAAIEALWGADVLARTIAACPADVRTGLTDGRLVSGGWYPIAWYRELHAGLRVALPNDATLSAKLGRQTTVQDLQGPMRWILSLAGPDVMARFADRMHSAYFRGGKGEATRRPGQLVLRLSEMHGMNKSMWDDLVAGSVVLFETAAGHSVDVRVVGGIGSMIEITLSWDQSKSA